MKWLKRRERRRIQKELHRLLLVDLLLGDAYEDSGITRYAIRKVMDIVHDGDPWQWWDDRTDPKVAGHA